MIRAGVQIAAQCIGAEWRRGTSATAAEIVNPATSESLGSVTLADQADVAAPTGNIGVNIAVAAPMAYFPFSGWKDSFLGVLHGQGRDAVEFYTDKKVVVERWPKEWSRKFSRRSSRHDMRGESMTTSLDRRTFTKALALGLAGSAVPALGAQKPRRLKVGHTGITWGFSPADAERAIGDASSLGFHGYESFGNILEAWESKGGLDTVLNAAKLPLRSAYCPVNLTDPAKRKAEVETLVRWGQLIKKCGGTVAVIGPNNVKRLGYVFAEHKANIVEALNEMGKALTDIGIVGALHQHTDTCIETREETYAVMEAVDTRYMKFGPDVGQLQKGGADPVKVVKDLLPTIRHVHMKDFEGGPHYLGYCPLGQGKVDIAAICDLLEGSGNDLMIMCELDPSKGMPVPALECARINKQTMHKLGYTFRS